MDKDADYPELEQPASEHEKLLSEACKDNVTVFSGLRYGKAFTQETYRQFMGRLNRNKKENL